jgi:hypothetical protein
MPTSKFELNAEVWQKRRFVGTAKLRGCIQAAKELGCDGVRDPRRADVSRREWCVLNSTWASLYRLLRLFDCNSFKAVLAKNAAREFHKYFAPLRQRGGPPLLRRNSWHEVANRG